MIKSEYLDKFEARKSRKEDLKEIELQSLREKIKKDLKIKAKNEKIHNNDIKDEKSLEEIFDTEECLIKKETKFKEQKKIKSLNKFSFSIIKKSTINEKKNNEKSFLIKKRAFYFIFEELSLENILSDFKNYFIAITLKRNTGKEKSGKILFTVLSGKIENLEKNSIEKINLHLNKEFIFNYLELKEYSLFFEIWGHSNWFLNTLEGECEINLFNIINGNIQQSIEVFQNFENEKKKTFNLFFKCIFQEKKNFEIHFKNLRILNIQNKKGEDFKAQVFLQFPKGKFGNRQLSTSISEKKDNNFYWKEIKKSFKIYCSLFELENLNIIVSIYDTGYIKNELIANSSLSLKRIINESSIEIPLMYFIKNSKNKKFQNSNFYNNFTENNSIITSKAQIPKNENLTKNKKHYTSVLLETTVQNLPKYYQKDQTSFLSQDKAYLIIDINNIDNLNVPGDIGILNTFLEVEWANQIFKSKTYYDSLNPKFKEKFYFSIPLTSRIKKGVLSKEQKNEISDFFELNQIVKITVWIEKNEMSLIYLGTVLCELNDLKNNKIEKLKFFDYVVQKEIERDVSIVFLKKNIHSAIKENSESFLNFKLSVIPKLEEGKDIYFQKMKTKNQLLSPIIKELLDEDENSVFLITWLKDLDKYFDYDTDFERLKNLKKCFIKDQISISRFIPTFITSINISFPEINEKDNELENLTNLKTCEEFFEFISNFEIEKSQNNLEYLLTSDIVLKQKKGNISELSIILCNFFNGYKKPKKKIGNKIVSDFNLCLSERTFLCLGKNIMDQSELFLMNFTEDLRSTIFWDLKNKRKIKLYGTVKENEIENLTNLLKKKIIIKKKVKNNENNDSQISKNKKKKVTKVIEKKESLNLNVFEDNFNDIDFNKNNKEDIYDSEIFRKHDYIVNPEKNSSEKKKYLFFQIKKKEEEKKIQETDKKYQIPINNFYKNDNLVKNPELPWKTIELIFNNKNLFANIQNEKPDKIYYNLNNKNRWKPLFKNYTTNEIWNDNLGSFIKNRKLYESFSKKKLEEFELKIQKDIQFTINYQRSFKNMETKWKNKNFDFKNLFNKYLKILQAFQINRLSKKKLREFCENWKMKLIKKIPAGFEMNYLSLQYNSIDAEKIRLQISEKYSAFYLNVSKPAIFIINVKIFGYINQIFNTRILICYFVENKEKDSPKDLQIQKLETEFFS